jgi:hypothetical protein
MYFGRKNTLPNHEACLPYNFCWKVQASEV